MTQELIGKRIVVPVGVRTLAKVAWHGPALVGILIMSAFLNLFRLTNEGYGIIYYAAAAKDMLTSWHNFFFASFDAGFVSVDKPPLGLWIQAASAKLFGFNGLSLMLPQALAGILCAALLYHLVRRSFGPAAGLVAALVLAVTPIVVATSRNNTIDMLLVLTMLLAAWAIVYAAESGRLRWLLMGALVVGLGFNIKMLEAFLVLPAFYLLYLVAAPVTRRRLAHLGAATIVLLVVSLSWALVVDLTPAEQRPYVGSTSDNKVTDLIFGYNGFDRLVGTSGSGSNENGAPGPLRFLNHQYAGQIGWLLPLSVVGLLVASEQERPRLPLDRRHQALVLWGTWFWTSAAYFSLAGGQHVYYTVMLAPAMAALVGVGVVALWSNYRSPGRGGWLLPVTLVGMAALHSYILAGYEGWSLRLTPLIVGLCLMAAAVLVVLRLTSKPKDGAYAAVAAVVGMLALLIAPTVWASYTMFQAPRTALPTAGPIPTQVSTDRLGEVNGSASGSVAGSALLDYLLANQGDAKYLLATASAKSTASIILNTDKPVISLGGYKGFDPVFTTKKLAALVNEGAVRFFLLPDRELMTQMFLGSSAPQEPDQQGAPPGVNRGDPGLSSGSSRNESVRWVWNNCQPVPQELWQPPILGQGKGGSIRALALYDCGTGER